MAGHHHHDGTRAFAWVTLINLAYTALEAGYGIATDSLALLSDALHNFGDVLGLGLAWGAAVLAKRPPSGRHTYGWRRATLLSPLANAMLLVAFSGALGWEAVRRFAQPPEVPGMPVMVVAAIGIAINLGAAWLVRDGHAHDLNRRGAFLHLVADAAVSLAAVLAGAGIWWLGWTRQPPCWSASWWRQARSACCATPSRRRWTPSRAGSTGARSRPGWRPNRGCPRCTTCTSGRWGRAESH